MSHLPFSRRCGAERFFEESTAPSTPSISVSDAIAKAEQALDGTHNGQPATIEYVAQEDGSAALVHVVQIQNDEAGTWYEAFVDAHSGSVISVTDFVAQASVCHAGSFLGHLYSELPLQYRVLPITKEYVTDGFETLTDPQDLEASPNGWHDDGTTKYTTTS